MRFDLSASNLAFLKLKEELKTKFIFQNQFNFVSDLEYLLLAISTLVSEAINLENQ